MFTATFDDSNLQKATKSLDKAIRGRVTKLVAKAMAKAAHHIGGRAVDKAPILEGHLRQSMTVTVSGGGRLSRGRITASIGFGGLASKYAEAQHENLEYVHHGQRKGKYAYLGAGTTTRQGDLNEPRKGGTKRWRRKVVHHRTRRLTADMPHKTGQHHFLFGRPDSAWEENEAKVQRWVADRIEEAFERIDGTV